MSDLSVLQKRAGAPGRRGAARAQVPRAHPANTIWYLRHTEAARYERRTRRRTWPHVPANTPGRRPRRGAPRRGTVACAILCLRTTSDQTGVPDINFRCAMHTKWRHAPRLHWRRRSQRNVGCRPGGPQRGHDQRGSNQLGLHGRVGKDPTREAKPSTPRVGWEGKSARARHGDVAPSANATGRARTRPDSRAHPNENMVPAAH